MSQTAADAAAAASRRLHPLTPFARGWKIIAVAIAFAGQEAAFDLDATRFLVGLAVVVPVAALYGILSWWFTRYQVDGDDLRLETGVVFRRTRHVRLERLQTVDVVRPLAARFLGLAELRLEVAGGTSSEAPLAYLAEPDARRLRAELLARAAGVAPETEEAPERVLVRVPASALATSIALSAGTVLAVLFGALLVVVAVVLRQPAVVIPLLPTVLGVAAAVSRSFTSNFDFTVAESPDGLRLRHGLLEQRSQTVPPGRIQAVRLVEPPLWRLLDQRRGWVKVEVNVAGYGGQGLEEGQRTSVLLPVAPRAVAHGLIARAVPVGDLGALELVPAPRRARWRRPITWRGLGYGVGDAVFVARRGVLRREVDIIAHGKTQSVRVTQGPWERRLRLASVHLDSTPGPVHVEAALRDSREARELVEAQAGRSRLARRSAGPDRWMTPPGPAR